MPTYTINAFADPNSTATVTILADAVRETQKTDYSSGFINGENLDQGSATSMFYVRGANLPPAGTYTVSFRRRRKTGASVNEAGWSVFLKLNGKIIGPVQDSLITVTSSTVTTDLTGQTSRWLGPDVFPIYSSSDVIEVCAQNDTITGTPAGIEILDIAFVQVSSTPPSSPTYFPATMPEVETPIGGASPDPATDNTGKFPDTKDMVVTDNGDIYVFTAGRITTANYCSRFSKYDVGTDTWSIIDDDVWGHGNPNVTGLQCWNAQLTTDGEDVWLSWGEMTTVVAGSSGSLRDWVWRCKFYDTSANAFTELGTGQSYYSHVSNANGTQAENVQAGSYDNDGIGLWISPTGVLWAAWVEQNPGDYELFSDFSGGATNLDGETDGFNSTDGANPAARDGSGNAVGTAAGLSGSYYSVVAGEEVPFPVQGNRSALLEVGALPTGSDWIGYEWSITGQGTGTRSYYRVRIKPNNDVLWERINSGTVTLLKTYTAPTTWVAGDRIDIRPFTSGINAYYKKAAGNWVFMGSSGTDSSPLSFSQYSAISFNGTSGKWSELRAGNLGDQRPCVFYWSGSAWVDTALELIPGGVRRSGEFQTVGTVKNNENARHIQLTFCHADGPNNNPSVFYTTEHSAPAIVSGYENQELQLHYNEWNGSSWGTVVTQGTSDVWPGKMYEQSNTSPFYYASNGFPQGFDLFTCEGSPWIVMCVVTHIGAVDLVGAARMAFDRSGFLTESDGNPDDPIRLYAKSSGGGPWFGGLGPGISTVVDSRNQIFSWVPRNDDQFGSWLLMRTKNGDPLGTGSNWTIGAISNNRLRYFDFDSYDKLALGSDNSIYVLTDITSSTLEGTYVFKWDPTGAIGDIHLSRIRFRAYQAGS